MSVTLQVRIDGGAPQTGGVTAAGGAAVQLTAASKAGWVANSGRFAIEDFPEGFACPAGWSTDAETGAYYYATNNQDPPAFVIPAERWGKFMFSLTAAEGAAPVRDTSTALCVPSPLGLRSVGRGEGSTFGGLRKRWVRELQTDLRTIDDKLALVFDSFPGDDPAVLDPTDPPAAIVGATGSYTEGNATHASSIDASISNLYYEYCFDAGLGAIGDLPVLVLMHGYYIAGEGVGNTILIYINQATRRRLASYGFLVVVPGLRGRCDASGTRDDSGREIHDIIDAVTHARGAFPAQASQTKAGLGGYSGGGGNVLNGQAKAPDFFSFYVAFFPITDYGKDIADSFWAVRADLRSVIESSIGGTPSAAYGAYRARNAIEAVPHVLALEDAAPLWVFWDDQDPFVPTSSRLATAIRAKGEAAASKLHYHESGVGDDIRWLHGYPDPGDSAQLYLAEYRFAPAGREAEAWTVPGKGRIRVIGWLKTKLFEIWTGALTQYNPRASAGGGTLHAIDLEYDDAARTYRVTPLTGSCMVQLVRGSEGRHTQCASSAITEIDLDSIQVLTSTVELGATHEYRLDEGVTQAGGDVAVLDDRIGALDYAIAANRPAYVADDGDGDPCASFDSGNTERLELNATLFDPNADWSFVCVLKDGGAGLLYWSQANAASPAGFNVVRFYRYAVSFTVDTYDGAGVADVAAATLVDTATYHCAIARYRASDKKLEISLDGSLSGSPKYASTIRNGGTITTTRTALGAQWNSGASASHATFKLRNFTPIPRRLSDAELVAAYQLMKSRWASVP